MGERDMMRGMLFEGLKKATISQDEHIERLKGEVEQLTACVATRDARIEQLTGRIKVLEADAARPYDQGARRIRGGRGWTPYGAGGE